MVVVIDSQIAGISGDMLLCSLVDLGADKSKIISGINEASKSFSGSMIKKFDFSTTKKHGIQATNLVLDVEEQKHERKGTEIKESILHAVEKLGLSQMARTFAENSISSLISAESKIHGEDENSVHFHEASSIDTLVDIVGTAIALDDLQFFDEEIISTPVAVGGGTVTFSHGTTSNPASAILEIFKNSQISIVGGSAKDELTTPTGACMLVSLAKNCNDVYPSMKIESIGYGAGTKDFEEFSNVLKIVKGISSNSYTTDTVQILETNVDDISGEVLGNMIERIMDNGAKDVTVSSAITKKGRPTNLVSVICDSNSVNKILELLISETGTLGIRIRTSNRIILPRKIYETNFEFDGKSFSLRYKISGEGSKHFKIESDDIKNISNSIKKSFRETEELIRNKIKEELQNV